MTALCKEKTAVVTGASSGIGLAIAKALFLRGWSVVLLARNQKRLAKACAELSPLGDKRRLLAVGTDVSKAAQVRRAVRITLKRFGCPDLWVNNAGIGHSARIEKIQEQDFEKTLAVNLKGVYLCLREILPQMQRRHQGYIINISSVGGKIGYAGGGAYCASKFGVMGLTQALIEEARPHNIKATAICPDYVETPMTAGAPAAHAHMLRPEDIAQTVLYLLDLSEHAAVREIVLTRKFGTEEAFSRVIENLTKTNKF